MITDLLNLQNMLFKKNVIRSELQAYKKTGRESFDKYTIKVYRNHSFEFIANIMLPFLSFGHLEVDFVYSDYDDSLSFFDFNDKDFDAVLIWIDAYRYKNIDVPSFVKARVEYLRQLTLKPILVCLTGAKFNASYKALTFFVDDLNSEVNNFNFYDENREKFTGTKLSAKASIVIARELATKYLPYMFRRNMKAIIVDLDNTLYHGILGEDGIENLKITQGHKLLQHFLANLSKQGFFICVVSKNEKEDVENLFIKRTDFSLRLDDITILKASWESKSASIIQISKELNIGTDSILFVDDNVGEIASVLSVIPDIKVVFAQDNAYNTFLAVSFFPGFFKEEAHNEDLIRKDDVQANNIRKNLLYNLNQKDYLKTLQMELCFFINDIKGLSRISELANKTNQFIFNYKRYSNHELEKIFKQKDSICVSFHLKDKLSDSGMIGALVLVKKQNVVILEELFISCRALGRGIDEILVSKAISIGMNVLKSDILQVYFTKGARNRPAEDFYEKHLKVYEHPKKFVSFSNSNMVSIKIINGDCNNGR